MSTCPNCKNKLSCGCQRRTASDGQIVCSGCLNTYQNKLKPKPVLENRTVEPQNNVWGKNRYKNLHKFVK